MLPKARVWRSKLGRQAGLALLQPFQVQVLRLGSQKEFPIIELRFQLRLGQLHQRVGLQDLRLESLRGEDG